MGKNVLIRLSTIAIIVSLLSILPLSSATIKATGGKDSALQPTSISLVLADGWATATTGVKGLPQIKPRYLRKADRETERLKRQRKKAYNEAIRENQRRSIEIQAPEVQERMKMNKKNSDANYRAKRKENRARSRGVARKFN